MHKTASIYVHVPFCFERCGYCDFNTYTQTDFGFFKKSDFAEYLCREIDLAAEKFNYKYISSIFFGGGTPTALQPNELIKILMHIKHVFRPSKDAEITLEANPDTINAQALKTLKKAGFNRISFGAQSNNPRILKILDRRHNPTYIPRLINSAKSIGFKTNIDIIYGVPTQTLKEFQEDIDFFLKLDPLHISAYNLIVEKGTKMHNLIRKGELPDIDDGLSSKMYLYMHKIFNKAGYKNYEISAFAKGRSKRSSHNLNYWRGGEYFGFGPGASGFLQGVRYLNIKHPASWSRAIDKNNLPLATQETLSAEDIYFEKIMLGLRTIEGVKIYDLKPATRKNLNAMDKSYFDKRSLNAGVLKPTLKGKLFLNQVILELLN